MALLSYKEFLAARESSASTRAKTAAALGLGPDVADVFGHGTPPPWQVEKLLGKLKKDKKHKRDKDKDEDDDTLEEREMRPDYSFDRLVRKAASAAEEIDGEIEKAEKESDEIDKKKEKHKKKSGPRPTSPHHSQPPKDASDDVDQDNEPSEAKPVADADKSPKKASQGDADDYTEEEAWLRLLGNTSFDPR